MLEADTLFSAAAIDNGIHENNNRVKAATVMYIPSSIALSCLE